MGTALSFATVVASDRGQPMVTPTGVVVRGVRTEARCSSGGSSSAHRTTSMDGVTVAL